MYKPKPDGADGELEVHTQLVEMFHVWSPVYCDHLPHHASSSIRLEPEFDPRGNNIWKDFAAGFDCFKALNVQITEWNVWLAC